ncbi:MAG: NIPSNAP family protein [candidate division KSB1 bacterium]|nr:NIPSNAP family protein [candidate division KSB1 bacterium]
MERREFLLSAVAATAAAISPIKAEETDSRCFYEWIRYESLNNSQKGRVDQYLSQALVPALNRLGIEPIGVFRPRFGADGRDTFVLIPHPSIDSFLTTGKRLAEDSEFQKTAGELVDPEMSNPLFHRQETWLLRAFSHLPKPEIPLHLRGKRDRIFEVRIYESHSQVKAALKIEMFNEGGEIALFKETGLNPVIFGETLAGANMPNLLYMLGFESMEEQAAAWRRFINSEGWAQMKDLPRYKDTVSSITDIILSPTGYSQI